MRAYVALLRSINVSGHHIIKMADLKTLLARPEFLNLNTYLQSGNLVFESEIESHEALETLLAGIIKEHYGYDIKVKVYDAFTFREIYKKNPFLAIEQIDTKKLYYIHVLGQADKAIFEAIKSKGNFPEEMFLIDNTIYVYYSNGYGRSKVTGSFFEKNLKLFVTARNNNTMKNLLEKIENLKG